MYTMQRKHYALLSVVLLMCSLSLCMTNKPKELKVITRDFQAINVSDQIPLAQIMGQVTRDRQELQELRDTHMQEYVRVGMNGNCMHITAQMAKATIAYVNKRIAETIKKLGTVPTRFCIFTMGSMARDESGFFTDLEIGILVEEKNPPVIDYFKRFNQRLADRFFLLGEHADVGGSGLRFDEADIAPDHLRWWARYASPEQITALAHAAEQGALQTPFEGSPIFVTTPQEFADLFNPTEFIEPEKLISTIHMSQKEKNIALLVPHLARNIRYMYGDNFLLDQYLQARDTYLQGPAHDTHHYKNHREEFAYNVLKYNVEKHGKPGSAIATGKLGDMVNIKDSLYRFPEEVLTSLGFLYDVRVQNTSQIVDQLVIMKHMSPEWGEELKDLMNFTVWLRLRKQVKLGKQGFDIPVTQKGYDELQQKLSPYDLRKVVPGEEDSILTPEIMSLLNTKYLPLEKKLYEFTKSFCECLISSFFDHQ